MGKGSLCPWIATLHLEHPLSQMREHSESMFRLTSDVNVIWPDEEIPLQSA